MRLTETDAITLHQAYEGVLGIGSTGSGKTSTLAHLMAALMRQGVGMLILTAKADDFEGIARIARETGRLHDLRRFTVGSRWKLDFLNWELNSPGGSIESGAQLMSDLVDFASRTSSQNSRDPFWPMASVRQIRMAMVPIWLAYQRCSVQDVYRYITSLPYSIEQKGTKEWVESICAQTLLKADAVPGNKGKEDLELAAEFAVNEFPRLGDKTSAGITATSMNALMKFMHGEVRDLVASGETNLSPDDVLAGRIVMADMPVLKYCEPGQFVQLVWKLLTIRACLRRDLAVNPRPVCIWADEAQLHATPKVDSMTQAVARSHRLINVAITQNLPLLESVIGSREETHAWVSNLQTKPIFANGDKETNEYFSAMFGQEKELMMGGGGQQQYSLVDDFWGRPQGNTNWHEQWLPAVRPEDFTRLRKGGSDFGYVVDCYCFQGGRKFSNAKT